MVCPHCKDSMRELKDVYALGKALDASHADVPMIMDKINIKSAMFVNVYQCQNQNCRHVSLSFREFANK